MTATVSELEAQQFSWYKELLRRALWLTDSIDEARSAADLAFSAQPYPPEPRPSLLAEPLLAEIEGIQFALECEHRSEGCPPFQGPSGRWFTKNANGRVCPMTAPEGTHPTLKWPPKSDDLDDVLAMIRKVLIDDSIPDRPSAVLDLIRGFEQPHVDAQFSWNLIGKSKKSGLNIWENEQGRRLYQEKEPGTRGKGKAEPSAAQPGQQQPEQVPGQPSPEQQGPPKLPPLAEITRDRRTGLRMLSDGTPASGQSTDKIGRRICYDAGRRSPCPRKDGRPSAKAPGVGASVESWQAEYQKLSEGGLDVDKVSQLMEMAGQMRVVDLQQIRRATGGKYARTKEAIRSSIESSLRSRQPIQSPQQQPQEATGQPAPPETVQTPPQPVQTPPEAPQTHQHPVLKTPSGQAFFPASDLAQPSDVSLARAPSIDLPQGARPMLGEEERKALWEYTNHRYQTINKSLREGGTFANPKDAAVHQMLQQAFSRAATFPEPVATFRGVDTSSMRPEARQQFFDRLKKAQETGTTITMPGYSSTSTRPSDPDSILDVLEPSTSGIVLKINARRGLDVKPYASFPAEWELLLDHNSKFKVTGINQHGSQTLVEMEHVLDETPAAEQPAAPEQQVRGQPPGGVEVRGAEQPASRGAAAERAPSRQNAAAIAKPQPQQLAQQPSGRAQSTPGDDLYQRAAGGDQKAQNELLEAPEVQQKIRGMIGRMMATGGIKGDVPQDLAQDVNLKLLMALRQGKLDPKKGNFQQYASLVTSNVVRDWFRRKKVETKVFDRLKTEAEAIFREEGGRSGASFALGASSSMGVPYPELAGASLDLILDYLVSSAAEGGIPSDEGWARAQQVLDWLDDYETAHPEEMPIELPDLLAEPQDPGFGPLLSQTPANPDTRPEVTPDVIAAGDEGAPLYSSAIDQGAEPPQPNTIRSRKAKTKQKKQKRWKLKRRSH